MRCPKGHLLADPRICENCGGVFQPRAEQVQRGHGRYCSRHCSDTGGRCGIHGRTKHGGHLPTGPVEYEGAPAYLVPLPTGEHAIIDPADRNRVAKHAWRLHSGGYVVCNVRGSRKGLYLHRLILPCADGLEPDHINRNKLDNRACNLRPVTRQENCWNGPSPTKSSTGVQNVRIDPRSGRYFVRFIISGKYRRLGTYGTLAEAAEAAAVIRQRLVDSIPDRRAA